MSDNCILCMLRREEIEVTKLYEDEILTVVLDIQPVNSGHLLIFPKECVQLMTDLDDSILQHMITIAKKMNQALRNSGLPCEGVNLFMADGEAAMQEIPHCHLHVFPRFAKDGFGFRFPKDYSNLPSRTDIEEKADKIRSALEGLLING